jgi:thioredoxin 1
MTPITSKEDLEKVIAADDHVFIKFFAEWCGPCKQMAPIVDKLAAEFESEVKFYTVDADALPDVCAVFGVRALPSLVMIKDKKVTDFRLKVGMGNETIIRSFIEADLV